VQHIQLARSVCALLTTATGRLCRAVDFVEEQASAPSDLQSIFEEVEFLAFRRRVFEANTMYDEIMRRGKFAEAEA